MKKSVLTKAASVALAIMILGACAPTNQQKDPPESQKAQSTANSTPAAPEEKPVLQFLGSNRPWDVNKDPTVKVLEDMTGYKVEYSMLPADNPQAKLNLILSSGTECDAISLTLAQFRELATTGALEPLNDLIKENAPIITQSIDPEYMEVVTYDGKIMGIPSVAPNQKPNDTLVFRKDILAKVGVDVDTNWDVDLETFYQTLIKIRDQEKMIPITGIGWLDPTIASAFGLTLNDFAVVDGDIVPLVKQEDTKAYLAYMQKLYKEKLIDTDWPINKRANVDEKFTTGKAAMTRCNFSQIPTLNPALVSNIPGAELGYMFPMKDSKGERHVKVAKGIQNVTVIPKSSKNKEHVLKWTALEMEEDNFKNLVIGQEGVHYSVKDGKYWPIQPKFEEERNNSFWYMSGAPTQQYMELWPTRVRKSEDLYNAYIGITNIPEEAYTQDPIAFATNLTSYSKFKQSLSTLFADGAIKIIAGSEKIDYYDKLVADWEANGGADVEKEVKAWYSSKK